jgi:hypothetical protein
LSWVQSQVLDLWFSSHCGKRAAAKRSNERVLAKNPNDWFVACRGRLGQVVVRLS